MERAHRWGLGARRCDNTLRFLTFSLLHLLTYLANVGILIFWCHHIWKANVYREPDYLGKVAYVSLLAIAHLVVGVYCTYLAMGDRGIRSCCLYAFGPTNKPFRYLFGAIVGFTQVIQLKVAWDKFTRRRVMPMSMHGSDEEDQEEQAEEITEAERAALVEQRIPWAFPSKCFEGIFEGCVFAFVLLYAILKIGFVDEGDLKGWSDSRLAYNMIMFAGIGSFCTVGMSMLNFDYHLSPAVQKAVDHSMLYTFLHGLFRSCEAGVRVSMVVFGALSCRSCTAPWIMGIPYLVLVCDYFCGVAILTWLSADEERQLQSLKKCKGTLKRILVAMITGLLLLLTNLAEFVDEADRRQLRRSANIFSRTYRCIRFGELLVVVVLCFATPCRIHVPHAQKQLTLVDYLMGHHKLIFFAFVIATFVYYAMVLLSFHCLAIEKMDGIELLHGVVSRPPRSNDAPRSNDVTGSRGNVEIFDQPLLRAVPAPDPLASRVLQRQDKDMPESLKEDLDADGTFYAASDNEYCIMRAPSLSFLLMSKGLHGSVANMVLARIDENDALPGDTLRPMPRVEMSDFEIIEKLGAGNFGNVWKCRRKDTQQLFAMKRLVKNNYVRRKGAEAEFPKRERDALFLAGRHPNVAYLECAFETVSFWVLVTELCDLGSLSKFINRKKGGLCAEEARVVGTQILEGLHHLHNQCILHRDIKPDNVGVSGTTEAPIAKLIDFGFAKRAEASQSSTIVGSYGYCAPEIDCARKVFGPLKQAADVHDGRIDIYSYGVLLFVVFASREAWTDGADKSPWTHLQFRGMLRDAFHPMWKCRLYRAKGIDGTVILKRMKDSLALDAIIAMTETFPHSRTANTVDALQLSFFTRADQRTAAKQDSMTDAINCALAVDASHVKHMLQRHGKQFQAKGSQAETWIQQPPHDMWTHEQGRLVIEQLGEPTKPDEDKYYTALLTFQACIEQSKKQSRWSQPIPFVVDFFEHIRAALRRNENEDDIIKTRTNREMTMDALANYTGDELKNLFPIFVQIQESTSSSLESER